MVIAMPREVCLVHVTWFSDPAISMLVMVPMMRRRLLLPLTTTLSLVPFNLGGMSIPRNLLRHLVCLTPVAVWAATSQRRLAAAIFLIPRSLLRRRFHRDNVLASIKIDASTSTFQRKKIPTPVKLNCAVLAKISPPLAATGEVQYTPCENTLTNPGMSDQTTSLFVIGMDKAAGGS